MLSPRRGVVQLQNIFSFSTPYLYFEGMQHGVIHDGEPKGLPLDVVTDLAHSNHHFCFLVQNIS